MTTGEKIKQLRKENGLTQKDLARKIGVSDTIITRYEKGIIPNIKAATLKKIADALGVRAVDLMCFDEQPDFYVDVCKSYIESLNDQGKEQLLQYLKLLSSSDMYKKEK